ncbi:hypothetical protein KJ596_03450 [Patescibacteria group bacterium]|nr:hypothetical protein [Patescibacteria group bacterium]
MDRTSYTTLLLSRITQAKGRSQIVFGGPQIGKTTLLKQLAARLIDRGYYPIWLSVKELATEKTILGCARVVLRATRDHFMGVAPAGLGRLLSGSARTFAAEITGDHRLVYIIDDIDTAPVGIPVQALIGTLIDRGVRFVVTSTSDPTGYPQFLRTWLDRFARIRLGLLSDQQVQGFLGELAAEGYVDFDTLGVTAQEAVVIAGPHPYLLMQFLGEARKDPPALENPAGILRAFFDLCWEWLTNAEREALIALVAGQPVSPDDLHGLMVSGLVRSNGRILGTACRDYVQAKVSRRDLRKLFLASWRVFQAVFAVAIVGAATVLATRQLVWAPVAASLFVMFLLWLDLVLWSHRGRLAAFELTVRMARSFTGGFIFGGFLSVVADMFWWHQGWHTTVPIWIVIGTISAIFQGIRWNLLKRKSM